MNCKPGDLAIYVGPHMELKGWVMRCVAISDGGSLLAGEPVWLTDVKHPYGHNDVRDSSLRPLRDPGEDARDETLDWLPVPEKEAA